MKYPLVRRSVIGLLFLCFGLWSSPLAAQSEFRLNYTTKSITPAMTSPSTLLHVLIPIPSSVTAADGWFTLTADTKIVVQNNDSTSMDVAQFLAESLRRATGYPFPVQGDDRSNNVIRLAIAESDPTSNNESYTLTVTPDVVALRASTANGLFYGVQTIRQLLPPEIDSNIVRNGPWQIAAGTIDDTPRFGWRGAMLDVSRHFFTVADVKRYIDLIAYYKMNRLHLHLSDDQGWRIVISAWPNLTSISGNSAVNGDPGGYYTQADYSEIVTYAQRRFVTIVPEIDMPGHTNAALAAYPELNCNGTAPAAYTGTKVGFSTLCVPKEVTYKFIDNVVAEVAALTPGPYFHIGGDESAATAPDDYVHFVERVQSIVHAHGKQMIGWEEVSQTKLLPTTIVQQWRDNNVQKAVQQGNKVIMSPANHAYLDMKYDTNTPLGLNWAGYVNVQQAYDWDPVEMIPGVDESSIVGVEAPIWSETLRTFADVEQMSFPRLIGIAEIGWSAAHSRSWDEYKTRLANQGPRLTTLGVNFYRSPEVNWL